MAAEINAKATVTSGFTAEKLISGEADLAVQQISELKLVDGVEIVGRIPPSLQTAAVFSAGRMTASKHIEHSDHLLRYFACPEVLPLLRESGLEQP
jgi:molybdate transport system substrate-binding protein